MTGYLLVNRVFGFKNRKMVVATVRLSYSLTNGFDPVSHQDNLTWTNVVEVNCKKGPNAKQWDTIPLKGKNLSKIIASSEDLKRTWNAVQNQFGAIVEMETQRAASG